MNGIVAENGMLVTDEMIAGWETALERDEWPSEWENVGEVFEAWVRSSRVACPAQWPMR